MENKPKSISIIKIGDSYFFRAYSRTSLGMSLKYGPYFMVNVTDNKLVLGEQCLKTFKECKTGIPHPEDLTKLSVLEKEDPYSKSDEAKLLKKLKKTYKDLRLGINFDGNLYTFFPYKILNKNAAEGIKGVSLTSNGNPEDLGKTLLQAFELCE